MTNHSDRTSRLRSQIVRALESQAISLPTPDCGLTRAIQANLIAVDIVMADLRPKSMQGYGAVSDSAAAELNGFVGEMQSLVSKLNLYLMQGGGQDLQGRLQRLEQQGDVLEQLKLLEQIITAHGFVEFRAMLAMILDRLEDKRFEIALFGRVSSGKSSLLNYLLERQLLPVGVTPITAVPTRIVYGKKPQFLVWLAEQQAERFALERLSEFVTEQQNPGNIRRVTRIVVELPSPRLQDGLAFVDTPGLGSLASAGAAETLAYLPRCDLGLVLIDAGSTLTEEDLATIRALYEAAIPVFVLLSKADLLCPADQASMLQYITEQMSSQLGLTPPVYPISVLPEHAKALNRWLEEDVLPHLIDRHQQLAQQSLHRKIGALREGVEAMLQMKLTQAQQPPRHPEPQRKGVETALRQATEQLEDTRIACETLVHEIAELGTVAIARSAETIVAQWVCNQTRELEVASLVHSTLVQVSAAKATVLYRHLHDLAQTLTTVLIAAGNLLDSANVPLEGELTAGLSALPSLNLSTFNLELLPPLILTFSKRLAERQVERTLQEQIGSTVSSAFVDYRRLLKAWMTRELAALQHQFDGYADTYRAQFEGSSGATELTRQDQEAFQHDLDRLVRWQVPNEITEPPLSQTSAKQWNPSRQAS
jgi:GTP-binding protein EngB required for normal cell division